MIKIKLWCLASFAALLCGGALAAEPLEIGRLQSEGSMALIPRAVYFEEPAARMNITDLRRLDSLRGGLNWQTPQKDRESFNPGYSASAYWIKFSVRGDGRDREWLLQQSYPMIDRLDVFVYGAGSEPTVVYRSGDHLPFASRDFEHRTFVFPIAIGAAQEQTVYIRVHSAGSLRLPLVAWTPEAFYQNEATEKPLIWMYYGVMLAMMAYNLFVYASVRDPAYAFYVLYLLALTIVTAGVDGTGPQYLWPNWPAGAQILNLLAIYFTCGALAQFTRYFLELPDTMRAANRVLAWLARSIFVLALLGAPVGLWLGIGNPAAAQFYRIAVTTGVLLALSTVAFVGLASYVLLRHRVRQAAFYLAAFVLCFFGAALQILGQFGVLPASVLSNWGIPLGTVVQVVVLSLGLADRINTMKNRLEGMNTRLEGQVAGRTRELEDSLQELRDLKTEQDGDYYLTSLLIAPLTSNRARGANVQVETLTEQKKKFQFRRWRCEIGGDLCVAHSLRLRGRSCTVFLNADAMGKSMQGAGGALVIGAAFQSIIDRTQSDPASANRYPEKWLEYAFQQLNLIFETFDGSMLVSIALGVIDDESGTLYYVNAEHPWSVLYRQGRASFIETEPHFRKLGMPEPEARFSVRTLQMEPGDVLIAGSDGRDDLIVTDAGGVESMTQDENQFLAVVEEAGGDLARIRGHLLMRGELSDDLSLMRIEYKPVNAASEEASPKADHMNPALVLRQVRSLARSDNWPGAIERLLAAGAENNGDPALRRELVRSYSKTKDYEAASQAALAYMEERPCDFEMLVAASRLCKKARKLELAIDLAERASIRQPQHLETLILLAELYARTDQYERAAGFLEMAGTRAPDDARVEKIRRYLYSPRA